MKRPPLSGIPLSEVKLTPGSLTITMAVGQWNALLEAGYKQGATLLELDADERPVAAYRLCTCDLCVAALN
jgi:hypothetical protein